MSLRSLMKIILPPQEPHEWGGSEDWLEVERSLGTSLPSDYKEYIRLYGTGELGGLIWVYNPFSDMQGLNLLVQAPKVLSTWRSKRLRYGEDEYPHRIYPEPNGLLPWAHVNTGAELFWQTLGTPDQWTVVVSEARGPEFEQFYESMTGFLVSLFEGRVKSDILPKSMQRKRGKTKFMPLK